MKKCFIIIIFLDLWLYYMNFGLNEIGITTTILLTIKCYRIGGKHKFRPFLYIAFKSILNKSLKEFVDLFAFSISDLFMNIWWIYYIF